MLHVAQCLSCHVVLDAQEDPSPLKNARAKHTEGVPVTPYAWSGAKCYDRIGALGRRCRG
ncbi:hypothetical protein L484_016960 [Morus notabilis]|uniref:Uncharacterized protein n=1 Tax=Morus notabilis TaxID=981085 RepID=W9QFV3_9ROSA|nr:hypothetical protein L484_016960 [Morus notabilis]